jgi:hypothetical protein
MVLILCCCSETERSEDLDFGSLPYHVCESMQSGRASTKLNRRVDPPSREMWESFLRTSEIHDS